MFQLFTLRLRVLLALGVCLGLLQASLLYAQTDAPTQKEKLRVVASFSILADWAREIGGDQVEVLALVGPDEDVHVYQVSPADLRKVSQADLMLINGLGLEGWFSRLAGASGFKGVLIKASDGVDIIYPDMQSADHQDHHDHDHDHDHDHGYGPDPHAWLSPLMAKRYVDTIAQAMIRLAPQHQVQFEQNRRRYQAELDQLDSALRQAVQALPADRRQLVVPHSAFAYLERDYGLTFHSLQGMASESESSAAAFAKVVRTIRTQGIDAIFAENTSNHKLIQRVANEAGLVLGGVLISGALSKTLAPSYLEMMRYNQTQLVEAFGL